jgi:threonine/homoserine/homoserine lactone efflux protein
MLTPRFLTFLTATAILVITPGAATAVVIRNAIAGGRAAAFLTAIGVALANMSWAAASCAGLALIIRRYPLALDFVKWAGAVYLAGLGAHGLWTAYADAEDRTPGAARDQARGAPLSLPARTYIAQGNLTNLLNPAAAMFYTSYVPQFVPGRQSFVAAFLALSAVHVVMAFTCHCVYGLTVGGFTQAFSRPSVQRGMQAVSGVALMALGLNLMLGS